MNEESLFAAALERPDGAERRAFLDVACGGDQRLRDRVEQLLAADQRPRAVFDRVPTPADLLAAGRVLDTAPFAVTPTPPSEGSSSANDIPGYTTPVEVARGGMGVVYRARQVGLNRDVALKMLLGEDAADEGMVIRFLAEAEAVAAIDHPHVIRVFEFGRHAGRPFLAMEYLSGGTLADRLKAGPPFTPADGAVLVRKLAAGVGAAHDLGIVHRDLKPGNVLFDDRGEPKVADFGLAKRRTGVELTQTGVLMGTPAYMAPEQARGNAKLAGPAADVWALGVVLYECLTGRRPFDGPDSWAVLNAVLASDPPAPRSANPAVPRDLDLVCRKCLAKDPRDRYPTAGTLADDLGRFLAGRPVTARPAGPAERAYKWARRRPAVAGLMAALLALLAASLPAVTVLWLRAEAALGQADAARRDAQAAEAAAVRGRIDADQARVRTLDLLLRQYAVSAARGLDEGDPVAALLWSAEGLKEAADDPAREREHRVRLAAGLRQCWPLVGAWRNATSHDPAFTPDGRAMLVCDDGVAQLVDVATGRPVGGPWGARASADRSRAWNDRSRPDPAIERALLSPDGRFVAGYSRASPEYAVWDVRTGERVLTAVEAARTAAFDPTSRRVAFSLSIGRVVVYDLPGGRVAAEVTGLPEPARQLVFDRTGDRLIVNVWALPRAGRGVVREVRAWDLKSNRAIGVDYQPAAAGTVAFDRVTGAPVFASPGEAGEVRVRNLATGEEQVLAAPAGVDGRRESLAQVEVSPDGIRVLAIAPTSQQLHLWDLTTGKPACPPLRVADGGRFNPTVEFTPDGSRVAACGNDGTVSVWEVPTGRRVAQFRHPGRVQSHWFSPDGRLLLTAGGDATVQVWDAETGEAVGWPLAHCGRVQGAGFAPGGRGVWTVCEAPGSADGLCCLWNPPPGDEPHPVLPPEPEPVQSAHFAGADCLVINDWFTHRATAIGTGRPARPPIPLVADPKSGPPAGPSGNPTRARWNAELTQAAVVTERPPGGPPTGGGARAELWDWAAGRKLANLFDGPVAALRAVQFSPRGDRLLTLYGEDHRPVRLDLWDAATGARVATLTAAPDGRDRRTGDAGKASATGAFFGRGGATVYATGWTEGGTGPGLMAWDATTGRPEDGLPFHPGELEALSPDGRLLVTADWAGHSPSAVWDLTAGKPARLWSLAGRVETAQFGPGGRLVTAVQSETGTAVRVWDAASGRPLTPAIPRPDSVRRLAFDPAGLQVLVVSEPRWGRPTRQHEVQVLDAGTGQPLTPRLTAPAEVLDARFTPDGRAVEAALRSGAVVRWDCSPSDESPALLSRLAAVQTGRELDPSGTPVPLPRDRLIGAVAALRAERPDRFRLGLVAAP